MESSNTEKIKELTEDGLANAEGRKSPSVFTEEGAAKALEMLKQYGIEI